MSSKDVPGCSCGQMNADLAWNASSRKSSLFQVTCTGCGKEFLSNVEKDHCYDCEKKAS